MRVIATIRPLGVCVVLAALSACASVPRDFEQVPSTTWQHPEATRLGSFFEAYAPSEPGLSGVYLLDHPREAFKARFNLAGLAERSLDLQYYLWKGDLTGDLLLYRALQAADRGVQVRILIDDVYHSGRDEIYASLDAHPEVEIRVYNPMGNRGGVGKSANLVYHKGTLDHRMHNKIFLADGAVAVLGGRNIGDDYFGADAELNFRDLDVLAVGAAASDAGAAFDTYWNSPAAVPASVLLGAEKGPDDLEAVRRMVAERLDELDALPYTVPLSFDEAHIGLERVAEALVWAPTEIVVDSLERFESGSESAFVTLTDEIARTAERDIVIETAYLIPAQEGIEHVERLTERGVRLRILTNSAGSNNHSTVHAHYRKWRKKLLRAGAELHELRAEPEILEHFKAVENRVAESHAGLHAKAFVVDARLSMIGSYNMDPRSRIWNSEIGLLIDSEVFAAQVLEVMELDLDPANSYRVTLDEDGGLVWTAEGPDGLMTWHTEPETSGWDRFLLKIMGWIPMAGEL